MNQSSLADLSVDDSAVICDCNTTFNQRLNDLGFVSGSVIWCRFIAPAGTPRAFEVKGSVIALRLSDCQKIHVEYDDRK